MKESLGSGPTDLGENKDFAALLIGGEAQRRLGGEARIHSKLRDECAL